MINEEVEKDWVALIPNMLHHHYFLARKYLVNWFEIQKLRIFAEMSSKSSVFLISYFYDKLMFEIEFNKFFLTFTARLLYSFLHF